MVDIALHRKLKIEQHESGVNSGDSGIHSVTVKWHVHLVVWNSSYVNKCKYEANLDNTSNN
jgi:hypothetical protein